MNMFIIIRIFKNLKIASYKKINIFIITLLKINNLNICSSNLFNFWGLIII